MCASDKIQASKSSRCCHFLFSGMCRRSSLQPDVKGTGRQRVGIRMCVLRTSTAALSIDVAPLLLFIINDLEKSSSCFPPIGLFPASDALGRHHVRMSSRQFSVITKSKTGIIGTSLRHNTCCSFWHEIQSRIRSGCELEVRDMRGVPFLRTEQTCRCATNVRWCE